MPKIKSPEDARKLMSQEDASIRQLLIDAGKDAKNNVDKALAEAIKLQGIAKQEKD